MEKDQTEEPKTTDLEVETEEKLSTESQEPVPAEPQVIVKKSGGALSLLISLVALAGVAYLFYQDYQAKNDKDFEGIYKDMMDRAQQRSTELSQELQRADQESEQLKQQVTALQKAIEAIQSAPKEAQPTGEVLAFDNSENEARFNQMMEQITQQAETIADIQNNTAQPDFQVDRELPDLNPQLVESLKRVATSQTLVAVQTLLDTGQFGAAQQLLERHLAAHQLSSELRNQLQQLTNQIAGITTPDPGPLKQELAALRAAISGLTLPTVSEESKESSWYDRFISVKKIDETADLGSSAQLLSLQAQLDRLLSEAAISLTLKQSAAWQQTLSEAATLLQQKLPGETDLIQRLRALATQAIKADLPAEINIDGMINALQGPTS